MKRKGVWLSATLGLLVGTHTAWVAMTDTQAKALGEMVYNDPGSKKGIAALDKLNAAANAGVPAAQNSLGSAYYNGRGVPKSDLKAAYWWRKAAEQGDVHAQNNLGNAYDNGRGVPKNYAKAVYWYKKAAAQGDVEAQLSLGVSYYRGRGVPQKRLRAIYWWKKAAAQGNQTAQRNLQIAEGDQ